jgi:signal transduction histidine kinase
MMIPANAQFRRFSLFGQTAVLMAAAILVAQMIGFLIFAREGGRPRSVESPDMAVQRFAQTVAEIERAPRPARALSAFQHSDFGAHYALTGFDEVSLRHLPLDAALMGKLAGALRRQHVSVVRAEASATGFGGPTEGTAPEHRRTQANVPPFGPHEVNMAAQLADGSWLNADFPFPPPIPFLPVRIGLVEIVLYAIVLSASLLLVARFIRPLRELGSAAARLGMKGRVEPIPVRGPSDVRSVIASFNLMAARIVDLLTEKDRMIAAIGHDLRTPLASMRIRVEEIESATERMKLVESIDDAARIVEGILHLARPVADEEPFALVDLSALAESVVDEFQELGKNARFADAQRSPVVMQSTAVKRMLRNLIENAIKFGGEARVSIETSSDAIALCVDDSGPGIPSGLLSHVTEPFVRLEQSRNSETGGIGLGLAIATAIARSHDAQLELLNLEEGGLRARVLWYSGPTRVRR